MLPTTIRRCLLIAAACLLIAASSMAAAADWITAPSYFTHDPYTGERVAQFARPAPSLAPPVSNYVRSGYRHTRSSLRVDQGADHLHIVEQWGRPVRPYGEWLYPYRPYSVPYPLWGPPPPLVNLQPYYPQQPPPAPGGALDAIP